MSNEPSIGARHVDDVLRSAFEIMRSRFESSEGAVGSPIRVDALIKTVSSAALDPSQCIAVFSLAYPAWQVAMQLIAHVGKIGVTRLHTGQLRDEDWPRVTSAINALRKTQLYIADAEALTPLQARAELRRLHEQVDRLGLFAINAPKHDAAAQAVVRGLKSQARELDIPFIATHSVASLRIVAARQSGEH